MDTYSSRTHSDETPAPSSRISSAPSLYVRHEVLPSVHLGWAVATLEQSLSRVVLTTLAAWQVVMAALVAAAASTAGAGYLSHWWLLLIAHLGVGIWAILAWRESHNNLALFLSAYLIGAADYLAVVGLDSAMALAACWQANLVSLLAAVSIRKWQHLLAVAGTGTAALALAVWYSPIWPEYMTLTVSTTQLYIVVAVGVGLAMLYRVARWVDSKIASAEDNARAQVVQAEVAASFAQDVRTLHDTVINTLAAIVSGRVGRVSAATVRQQCLDDAETLTDLELGQYAEKFTVDQIFEFPGLTITRQGLSIAELARALDSVELTRVTALIGSIREVLRNVIKHAGVSTVFIDSRFEPGTSESSKLVLTVRDYGVGFNLAAGFGTGLERSVFERVKGRQIQVKLESEPGRGTSVEFALDLAGDAAQTDSATLQTDTATADTAIAGDAATTNVTQTADAQLSDAQPAPPKASVIEVIQRRSALLWGAGIALVSMGLYFSGDVNREPLAYMIGLQVLCWCLAMGFKYRWVRAVGVPILVVSGPVVFMLAGASVEFGMRNPVHWQGLAATGPVVLLLSESKYRKLVHIVLGAGSVSALIYVLAFSAHPVVAKVQFMLILLVGVGFCFVWDQFMAAVGRLGVLLEQASHEEFVALRKIAAQDAVGRSYERWVNAGLGRVRRLLVQLGHGNLELEASSTVNQCAQEELYLRQIISLNPALVNLGSVLPGVLAQAKEAGIQMMLSVGDKDVHDEREAQLVAGAITECIAVSAPDSRISATLFPEGDGVRFTLISAAGAGRGSAAYLRDNGAEVEFNAVDSVEILESAL